MRRSWRVAAVLADLPGDEERGLLIKLLSGCRLPCERALRVGAVPSPSRRGSAPNAPWRWRTIRMRGAGPQRWRPGRPRCRSPYPPRSASAPVRGRPALRCDLPAGRPADTRSVTALEAAARGRPIRMPGPRSFSPSGVRAGASHRSAPGGPGRGKPLVPCRMRSGSRRDRRSGRRSTPSCRCSTAGRSASALRALGRLESSDRREELHVGPPRLKCDEALLRPEARGRGVPPRPFSRCVRPSPTGTSLNSHVEIRTHRRPRVPTPRIYSPSSRSQARPPPSSGNGPFSDGFAALSGFTRRASTTASWRSSGGRSRSPRCPHLRSHDAGTKRRLAVLIHTAAVVRAAALSALPPGRPPTPILQTCSRGHPYTAVAPAFRAGGSGEHEPQSAVEERRRIFFGAMRRPGWAGRSAGAARPLRISSVPIPNS